MASPPYFPVEMEKKRLLAAQSARSVRRVCKKVGARAARIFGAGKSEIEYFGMDINFAADRRRIMTLFGGGLADCGPSAGSATPDAVLEQSSRRSVVKARSWAVSNGHDGAEEHEGFSVFTSWPTKWQASFLPVRSGLTPSVRLPICNREKDHDRTRKSRARPTKTAAGQAV
jgi:hypothetical protein